MERNQQVEKLEQEKKDLQRELNQLEQADNPEISAKRIMDYIAHTEEPLTDPNNPAPDNNRCKCCVIL